MNRIEKPPPAWIPPTLLVVLVATNALFLALLRAGGPFIGTVLYAVLLYRWQRRDYRAAAIGGLAGLGVHIVEVATVGWSDYPALMALNLTLPAALVPIAWLVCRQAQQADDERVR